VLASAGALAEASEFEEAVVRNALEGVLERRGCKPREVYQPLRVAISGTTISPGIFGAWHCLAGMRRCGASTWCCDTSPQLERHGQLSFNHSSICDRTRHGTPARVAGDQRGRYTEYAGHSFQAKRAATAKGRSAEVERRSGGSSGTSGARHQNEDMAGADDGLRSTGGLSGARRVAQPPVAVVSEDHVATADIVTAVSRTSR